MLTPQIPTPFHSSITTAPLKIMKKRNAIAKPPSQPRPMRLVSTIALILSVIDPNVWPGAITGGPLRSWSVVVVGGTGLSAIEVPC
jgi:hypothetical protein